MAVQVTRRQITVEDYHQMAQSGILKEDDKVELIHGDIIEMSPISSQHSSTVKRIHKLFEKMLGEEILVGVQDPVRINKISEPEPDISILKYRSDFYYTHHPTPEDTLLIIEVANSSLDYDREVKMPLYAEANIPAFWLVNLEEQEIEAYHTPQKGGYKIREICSANQEITFKHFNFTFKVNQLLGIN